MLALIYFRWMEIEHGCVTYLPTSHSELEFLTGASMQSG